MNTLEEPSLLIVIYNLLFNTYALFITTIGVEMKYSTRPNANPTTINVSITEAINNIKAETELYMVFSYDYLIPDLVKRFG
jgi:hypothetical protein